MLKRKNLKQDKNIIVEYACSLEDEIRFYISKDYYAVAREDENGDISLLYETENDEEDEEYKEETLEQHKSIFTKIKEQIKNKDALKKFVLFCKKTLKNGEFKRLLSATICEWFLLLIVIFAQSFIIMEVLRNNNFIYIGGYGFTILFIELIDAMIDSLFFESHNVKSKHSAEHKVINFIEKNNRMPKSIEEIKLSSRFSAYCGGRKIIHGNVVFSTIFLISTVLAYPIVTFVIQPKCKDELLGFCLSIVIDILISIILFFVVFDKLKFLYKIIETALVYVLQLVTTTRNVSERDLVMAYWAANLWIEKAYPQYYNWEDKFMREKLKNKSEN